MSDSVRYIAADRHVRRFFTPSTIVSAVIIAAVAAIVAAANWRDLRLSRLASTRPMSMGTRGANTGREDLARRIVELRAAAVRRPDDVGAAVMLADALVRQTRVTGNSGLAIEAEAALRRALTNDPSNYDANRQLGSLLLSQHRFREAVAVGEKNRDARPYDAINYGIIGDGLLELGDYDQAFEAFDKMMALRPSSASYARVAYARELQGNLNGAVEAMKLAADATPPDDPEALAWHHAQVGDLYLRLGRIARSGNGVHRRVARVSRSPVRDDRLCAAAGRARRAGQRARPAAGAGEDGADSGSCGTHRRSAGRARPA